MSKTFQSFARNRFATANGELNKNVSGVGRIISVRVAGRIFEGVKSSARNPRSRSLTQKHDFRTRSIVSWYSITRSLMQTTIPPLIIASLFAHVIKVQGAGSLMHNARSRSSVPVLFLRFYEFLSLFIYTKFFLLLFVYTIFFSRRFLTFFFLEVIYMTFFYKHCCISYKEPRFFNLLSFCLIINQTKNSQEFTKRHRVYQFPLKFLK